MQRVILVKHSAPQVDPNVAPQHWNLSARGRELCLPLAERIRAFAPGMIISSTEAKAVQTAQLLAQQLDCPTTVAQNLHEHDRSNVPHMRSGEFISSMELLFRRPDEIVLGAETATAALSRFRSAIDEQMHALSQSNLVIVTHGTVLALLLGRQTGRPAFELWRRMGLPSFAVLTVPEYEVEELVERVE